MCAQLCSEQVCMNVHAVCDRVTGVHACAPLYSNSVHVCDCGMNRCAYVCACGENNRAFEAKLKGVKTYLFWRF
jgi:hypothetical protein